MSRATTDRPATTFARRACVALAINIVIAFSLSFFSLVLRSYLSEEYWADLGYTIWLIASLAHLWYYKPERPSFKIAVTAASLSVNAGILWCLSNSVASF